MCYQGVAINRLVKMNMENGESIKTWRFSNMKKWHVNWEIRHLKVSVQTCERLHFSTLFSYNDSLELWKRWPAEIILNVLYVVSWTSLAHSPQYDGIVRNRKVSMCIGIWFVVESANSTACDNLIIGSREHPGMRSALIHCFTIVRPRYIT